MLIGKPTVFVRTGGCDYRCSWCDSLYAVLPEYKSEWKSMTIEDVFAEIQHLSGSQPVLVTLSGGNPAIQPLESLIDLGHRNSYTFAIETQGSVFQPWFSSLDYLTVSPKPPSSGQVTHWERLDRCVWIDSDQLDKKVKVCLKIVIFDEEDYLYAKRVSLRYPGVPLYLQVGNHQPQGNNVDIPGILRRMDWLIQKALDDQWYDATILPQLHVILWGNKRAV